MNLMKSPKQTLYEEIYEAAKHDNRERFRELFLRLHDRDQQEVFHLLYPDKKRKISYFLTSEEFAELFEWMDLKDQQAAVDYLPNEYIGEVFTHMPADDVAKFLSDSDGISARSLLQLMDEDEAERVKELLSYASETAGAIMTKEFISVHYKQPAKDVIDLIRRIGKNAETIYYVYVLNEKTELVGVLSLRDLLLSAEEVPVESIMSNQVISAPIDMDQEEVAKLIQDYDLLALPIIGLDGKMQGIVTFDDVMDVLEAEATEDFQEFAAINSKGDDKEQGIIHTARQRIPWIIILIFLSILVGSLISVFEETLESVVLLAAFIPMIMDTAGNVGTQSLAVAVRNINTDSGKRTGMVQTIKNEFGAGLLMGLVSSAVMLVIVMVLYQNFVLALIIAVSLLLTISMSTVVGAVIPAIANQLNVDPAIASGPFITTINDAIGLLIYFSIATALINYL